MKATVTTLYVPAELAQIALRLGAQYNLQNNAWFVIGPVPPLLKKVLRAQDQGGYVYPKQLCECPVCGFNLNHAFDVFTGTHFYKCGDESCSGRVEVNAFFSFFTSNKKDALTFEDDNTPSGAPVVCRTCEISMPRTFFGGRYWRVCTNSKTCHQYVIEDEPWLNAYESQDEDECESPDWDHIHSPNIKKRDNSAQRFTPKTLRLDELRQDLNFYSEKLDAVYDLLPRQIYYSGFVDTARQSLLALLGLYVHELNVEDTAEMFNSPIKFRNLECLLWQLTGLASGAEALEKRLIEECKRLGRAHL